MLGNTLWQYLIPESLSQYVEPGMDAEVLDNGNILIVLPRYGIHEIDRDGNLVWSHLDSKISHDADRLPNGNTLYGWGGPDEIGDDHVKEVNPDGEQIWSWNAQTLFNMEPYLTIYDQGWTHTNGVQRLSNGNTLVSLRNFNQTVEVTTEGTLAWSYDWSTLGGGDDPHEPERLDNGNTLVCLQHETPHQVLEIGRESGEIQWQYFQAALRTARDCDRLPNGNTLVQAVLSDGDVSTVFEVTPEQEIVWRLRLHDTPATGSPGWFYKAQRVCSQ